MRIPWRQILSLGSLELDCRTVFWKATLDSRKLVVLRSPYPSLARSQRLEYALDPKLIDPSADQLDLALDSRAPVAAPQQLVAPHPPWHCLGVLPPLGLALEKPGQP